MNLRDYLRAFRRSWLIVLACAALAVASAAALVAREAPAYTSTIRMFVSTPQVQEGVAYQGGLFSQQRVISYADLVIGEQVAVAVIEDLGLDLTPRQLESQLTSRVVPETVIFELTATDASPERARQIADAVGVEFTALVAELESPAVGIPAPIKVTTVDPADLATSPASPRPVRNIAVAAVLGLLAGLGLALLRDLLDVTVKDVDKLTERLGASTLGIIGYDADADKNPVPVRTRPQSPQAEAFRQLRTNLQFVDIDQDTKTIVITSSLPEEGKTRTSVNLAIALAQAGERVILVEADLRRPRVNRYLHLLDDVGVTTVLLGRLSVDEALQPYGDLPLHVLACGRQPPNPSELLSSERMQLLLRELRERADIIIIDAPPLLPVTDAAVLARQADGAILVVRHGKTTYDQVDRAVENLHLAGARLLGTLINMAPAKGRDAYAYAYAYQTTARRARPTGRRDSLASAARPDAPAAETISRGVDPLPDRSSSPARR